MMGPNNSGRMRRQHHHGPAGLTVADHAGLAVGVRMQCDDLFEKSRLGARDVLDGLARHRLGQKADEIAGMAGLEGDADLAVGLEAADARTVPGARIDDDERSPCWIDLDAFGRDHLHQSIVDRPLERAAVDDKLDLIVENMRGGLCQMLAILVAALAHDVPEQDAALRRIDHVLHDGCEHAKGRGRRDAVENG